MSTYAKTAHPAKRWQFIGLFLGLLAFLPIETLPAQQSGDANAQTAQAKSSDTAEPEAVVVARLQKKAEAVVAGVQKELDGGKLRQDVIDKVQQLSPLMNARKFADAEALLDELLRELAAGPGTVVAAAPKLPVKDSQRESLIAELPASRPFLLGFTPHDLMDTPETSEGVQKTLSKYADVVAVHIDRGVPWEEALNEQEFPAAVQEHLAKIRKVNDRLPGKPSIYLALTPIVLTRNDIAKYWGDNEDSAKKWQDRNFDDPEAILAYTRYCRRMIRIFQPDYFAYGIEANMLAGANPRKFEQFRVLAKQVYETLKQENPDLPIFLTFQIDLFHKIPAIQGQVIRQLLPCSDFLAVSSYPYMEGHTAQDLPEDWFSEVAALDPGKPFAIAETGFLADGKFKCQNGMTVQGSEQAQADYVRRIMQEANRLNGRFVVWFFAEDIDRFYETMTNPVMREFVGMWKDAGLVDENGRERESLKAWDRWFKLPKTSVRR